MQLPSKQEIKSLHLKYAPSSEVFDELWQHCEIVEAIALAILVDKKLAADPALVSTGALLHDIGVYRLYDNAGVLDETNYIRHGILGYELLEEAGFDEAICRFASHHTGVGLTAQDIATQNLPLPAYDMLADSLEERLVMYADKFHSKLPSKFNTPDWYRAHVARFGEDKVAMFDDMMLEFGVPDVVGLAEEYDQSYR